MMTGATISMRKAVDASKSARWFTGIETLMGEARERADGPL
jgi:hypothetical protein